MTMPRPSRRLLLPLALAAAAILAWVAARGSAVSVTAVPAVRDTLTETLGVEGVTRARESYTITAPVSGRLERLDVERGDTVEAGRVLGRILPAPQDARTVATLRAEVQAARAAREQASSRLAAAEARARQTGLEVERRRPLADMGALSREQMERVEVEAELAARELEAARAALAAAEASLETAEARLLGATPEAVPPDGDAAVPVAAPASGRVVVLPDRSGRVVAAGEPLLELADTDALEIVVDVLSRDAVRIRPGQEMRVTSWGGPEPFRGTVRTVTRAGYTEISALGVEEQRVDVLVEVPHPPESLGTGYEVTGEIVVWEGADVLSVPASAVFRSPDAGAGADPDGGWALFVIDQGRARLREVRVGRSGRERVQVLEGIEEGELVVPFPPAELEPGTRVRIVEGG